MINFNIRAKQSELTFEQIAFLQRRETYLGRRIYYSPYREDLRHLVFHYLDWKDQFPFEELIRVIEERIQYVENYSGLNSLKRKRDPEDYFLIEDEYRNHVSSQQQTYQPFFESTEDERLSSSESSRMNGSFRY